MVNETLSKLIEWQLLCKKWHKARESLIDGEAMLDAKVLRYLNEKGGKPDQKQIDKVVSLRNEEEQARIKLDHFISELS